MIRLFVGIALPEPVRHELAGLCAGVPQARWVAPESMHLTLRFIGEVDEGVAQDIHDGLATVRAPGFALDLAGVGVFGPDRHPSALWVGVDRSPALVHLRDKVDSAVVRAGLPHEPRKFTPHVTLARFREPPGVRLGDFLAHHAMLRLPPIAVGHFTLFSSHLGRNGATYAAEAEYSLGEEGEPPLSSPSPDLL